jgi:hypothetical protein
VPVRKIALVLLVLALGACSSDGPDQPGPTNFTASSELNMDDSDFGGITVQYGGRPLECLVWKDKKGSTSDSTYAYSGLSCNWEEWNDGNPASSR